MEDIPELIAFDVETTGLYSCKGDRIIEIALIRIKEGVVIDKIVSLINPEREIPPETSYINRITAEMVKEAPYFREIAQKIFDFIQGKTLLIHNADFDIDFLKAEFKLCGLGFPEVKILDTLAIARNSFCFPVNSLSGIAAYYNLATDGLHRAEADAMTAYKIYCKFRNALSQKCG